MSSVVHRIDCIDDEQVESFEQSTREIGARAIWYSIRVPNVLGTIDRYSEQRRCAALAPSGSLAGCSIRQQKGKLLETVAEFQVFQNAFLLGSDNDGYGGEEGHLPGGGM